MAAIEAAKTRIARIDEDPRCLPLRWFRERMYRLSLRSSTAMARISQRGSETYRRIRREIRRAIVGAGGDGLKSPTSLSDWFQPPNRATRPEQLVNKGIVRIVEQGFRRKTDEVRMGSN